MFNTNIIKISIYAFKKKNMADLFFAIEGQKQKIPFVCLSHSRSIVKQVSWLQGIYERACQNDKSHTEYAREIKEWQVYDANPPVIVKARKKRKFNLGCGRDIREGYINVDLRNTKGVNVVCDITKLETQYPDGVSASEIIARDVVEHLPQKESEAFISKMIGWLEKGGEIEIMCPDVKSLALLNINHNGSYPDKEFIRRLYGGQDYKENFHKAGYTLDIMAEIFRKEKLQLLFSEHINGNLWIRGRK